MDVRILIGATEQETVLADGEGRPLEGVASWSLEITSGTVGSYKEFLDGGEFGVVHRQRGWVRFEDGRQEPITSVVFDVTTAYRASGAATPDDYLRRMFGRMFPDAEREDDR